MVKMEKRLKCRSSRSWLQLGQIKRFVERDPCRVKEQSCDPAWHPQGSTVKLRLAALGGSDIEEISNSLKLSSNMLLI